MADSGAGPRPLLLLAAVVALILSACAPTSGGPPASPKVSCAGVPAEQCEAAIASVARSLPNTAPVSIDVTCASGSCSPEFGAMDIVVTLADGSQLRSATTTWPTGAGQNPDIGKPVPADQATPLPLPPPPGLPMDPVCVGVPLAMCRSMAESAVAGLDGTSVAQIVVTCGSSPCTDTQGTGDTLIRKVDGSTLTSSWGYATQ